MNKQAEIHAELAKLRTVMDSSVQLQAKRIAALERMNEYNEEIQELLRRRIKHLEGESVELQDLVQRSVDQARGYEKLYNEAMGMVQTQTGSGSEVEN